MADLTRRLFLRNTAAAGAVATVIAAPVVADAAAIEQQENPELIEAWKQFREVEKAYSVAKHPSGDEFPTGEQLNALDRSARRVLKAQAFTDYGIRLKGDVLMGLHEAWGIDGKCGGIFGASFLFACSVMDHTEQLNGKLAGGAS